MANLLVVGRVVVIKSALKYEDIELVKKCRPEALVLKDEDGNEYFAIGVTNGRGGINNCGVEFNGYTRDDDKFATLTVDGLELPNEGIKDYIADKYGKALINLNKIEERLPGIVDEVREERASIVSGISIS